MSSRHRRMVYSSSDSDTDIEQQQPQLIDTNDVVFENPIPNISTVTLNSTTTTTTAAAIDISDDDFIDVAENLSPPSPPPVATEAVQFTASGCPVNDELRRMGVGLKRDWLDSCKLGLANSVPGFTGFDVETKAKLCFGQLLHSDLNYVGVAVLPDNVCGLHLVDLAGPFVLQVDEVVNISCPLRERYKNAAPGLKRCLKLSMTDGVQRVFGMEYRPIKSLAALSPAGFKVVIRNVHVRRGLLMLVPEVLEILGGSVEELEAARQRLVQEVNKPPRGKRTRTGTVPPLSNRATHAAWPQNGVTDHSVPQNVVNPVARNTTDYSVQQNVVNPIARNTIDHSVQQNFVNPVARNTTDHNVQQNVVSPVARNTTDHSVQQNDVNPVARNTIDHSVQQNFVNPVARNTTDHNVQQNVVSPVARNTTDHSVQQNDVNPVVRNTSNSADDGSAQLRGDFQGGETLGRTGQSISAGRETTQLQGIEGTNQHYIDRETGHESMRSASDQYSINRESGRQSNSTGAAQHPTIGSLSRVEETHELPVIQEATEPPPRVESFVINSSSTNAVEDEDASEALSNSLILNGVKEFPFTYMGSLQMKWAMVQHSEPSVQGIVKGFVTGVKGFQYRGRSMFELRAYIEDGSLITEIFIHHNVVQNLVGYSPEQVTVALTSSNTQVVDSMKKTLLKFQAFLSAFEGTMLVQFNKTSRFPVVLEMNSSCIDINTRQLLHRVKPPTSSPPRGNDNSNVISLSP